MSEKKRSKRRKDEGDAEEEKPSKEELAVAKWLKSNVPTKKTKFMSHQVEYFTASKALDALMVSKFAQGDRCLFRGRESAIKFLNIMLTHKFFHRAKKVTVSDSELRRGKKSTEKEKDDENVAKKRPSKDEKASADDTEPGSPQSTKSKKIVEKKKRKIRLEMHPDQVFVDGAEAYVWIYDPIPMYYWAFGTLIVIAAIGVCLFPLWPPMIRQGVYYLSIAAAGFLIFVLGLTALRYVVFSIVWTVSGSKHHLWIFPNLTEDVGFFESFLPIYTHEYIDGSTDPKSKKKKHKKDKDSDEEDSNVTPLEAEKIENIKENETGSVIPLKVESVITATNEALDEEPIESKEQFSKNSSETEGDNDSESSHRSTDRDFEIVNTDDVDTS